MDNTISTEYLQFRYNLTELSAINYKLFLKSDKVEEKMLAILGNLASTSTESVLEQIVEEIETNSSALEQGRYFRQLRFYYNYVAYIKKRLKIWH